MWAVLVQRKWLYTCQNISARVWVGVSWKWGPVGGGKNISDGWSLISDQRERGQWDKREVWDPGCRRSVQGQSLFGHSYLFLMMMILIVGRRGWWLWSELQLALPFPRHPPSTVPSSKYVKGMFVDYLKKMFFFKIII